MSVTVQLCMFNRDDAADVQVCLELARKGWRHIQIGLLSDDKLS